MIYIKEVEVRDKNRDLFWIKIHCKLKKNETPRNNSARFFFNLICSKWLKCGKKIYNSLYISNNVTNIFAMCQHIGQIVFLRSAAILLSITIFINKIYHIEN